MTLHDQINMASTTQQDLCHQSHPLGLLSEEENPSATKMATSKKETPRFESFPPEIRNMIYKNLLSAKLCKKLILRQFAPHVYPQHQYTYIFHTAILRSNRLISHEAKSILYGGNILVLINWNVPSTGHVKLTKMPRNIAFNQIPKGAPPPSCVVSINHHVQHDKRTKISMIVTAPDVRVICETIHSRCGCSGCQPRASYSLVALPQPGWPYQRLLEMIWLPLKALREHGFSERGFSGKGFSETNGLEYRLKVIDRTGVFEQTEETSDWEDESEQESDTDSDRDSDTEEKESDGSSKQDNDSDDHDSNVDEVEDDEFEDIGRALSSSEDSDSGEDNDDEYSKAEDESDKGRSDDAGEKPSHGAAFNSSHDGDSHAAIVVKVNLWLKGL